MEGQGEEPQQKKKGTLYFLGSIRRAKLCDGKDKGGRREKGWAGGGEGTLPGGAQWDS